MAFRDVDLNLLRIFDTVYSTRSISRAADHLDLSQPAISNALARLRKQIGDPLFVRSGNGVAPTVRAEEMVAPIRQALTGLDVSLQGSSTFNPATSEKRFKIMLADPMEPIILPALVRKLQNTHGSTMEIVAPSAMEVEDGLSRGLIDFAVFLAPHRENDICSTPLCPVDPVFITRKNHPDALNAEALMQHGHVTLNLMRNALANSDKVHIWQRVPRRDVVVVHRVGMIAQIVSKSDLLGIVPRLYALEVADVFELQIIEPPVQVMRQQMFMIWHRRDDDNPAICWLRSTISDAVESALLRHSKCQLAVGSHH